MTMFSDLNALTSPPSSRASQQSASTSKSMSTANCPFRCDALDKPLTRTNEPGILGGGRCLYGEFEPDFLAAPFCVSGEFSSSPLKCGSKRRRWAAAAPGGLSKLCPRRPGDGRSATDRALSTPFATGIPTLGSTMLVFKATPCVPAPGVPKPGMDDRRVTGDWLPRACLLLWLRAEGDSSTVPLVSAWGLDRRLL